MSWSRSKSEVEDLMVYVLKKKSSPMSLGEIVEEMKKLSPELLTGKTPKN